MTTKWWLMVGATSGELLGAYASKSLATRAANKRNRAIDQGLYNTYLGLVAEKGVVVLRSVSEPITGEAR